MRYLFLSVAAALACAALSQPALSQTGSGPTPTTGGAVGPFIDPARVTASCAASGGGCQALVGSLLARLTAASLPPALMQSRIALLATSVLQAATGAPPALTAQLSQVLETLAAATDNPVQQTTIRQIAAAVAAGTAEGLPIGVAVAASAR